MIYLIYEDEDSDKDKDNLKENIEKEIDYIDSEEEDEIIETNTEELEDPKMKIK